MTNKLMISYFGIDFLFALTGVLLIAFSLISEKDEQGSPTIRHIANNILLSHVPLSAGIANAVIIFVTFVFSLPVFFIPSSRFWLHVHAYMTVVCGLFSLVLGIFIWFSTLRTRSRLLGIWTSESQLTQSLLQQRFNCCGYINSTTPLFVTDTTCTNALVAAQKGGCIGPFSSFANMYLDQIFTALFGIVAVDFLVIVWVAMVMKYRKEQERYRHIDEKNGMSGF